MAIIVNLLLLIDGLIYDLIGSLFEIFDFLSKVNLFSNDVYSNIVRRIYVVLGLIMMFALAYSLLKAVINPDEFSKGETSFPKLIKNVVVSLAIIAVLPTVFTVAFNIQNSLLNEDTIPKIVLGDEYESTYLNGGKTIAYNSFMAFLHVNESYCKEEYSDGNDGYNINECEKSIPTNASNVKWYKLWRLAADEKTFADVKQRVRMGDSIADFNQFGEAVVEGKLSYIMIISTIFGIFLLVVIANFCFDMALRIIKLMFFQIIAPIPVVCRVIPGGKMKDVFPTWIKKTTSTFLDVFIRIFVMYLGIFVILIVTKNWDGIPKGNLSGTQSLVAKALIIMGVVMFIRQAPKLLGDLFHLDTGSMKLGLMDKLKAGGLFAASNAVGSLIASRGNPLAAVRGWKHGMNNANFRNIGTESLRRRSRRDALHQGATRRELIADSVRRAFGYESLNKADDYNIANRVYVVRDADGNDLTLTQDEINRLETEKFNNSIRIAEIASSTSRRRDISSDNDIIKAFKKTLKDEAVDKIHKDDSAILEKLDIEYSEEMRNADLYSLDDEFTKPGSTMSQDEYERKRNDILTKQTTSLIGNYNSLKAQLEQNYKKGVITDDAYRKAARSLADLEKKMQEKFVSAACNVAGQRNYTNYDGSTISVDNGGVIHTNYQNLVNDLQGGVLRDVNGNTIDYSTFVDSNGNPLEGWDLVEAAFNEASRVNNTISVDINDEQRIKRSIEQANKAIDAIFEQRTKMQEQEKNSNSYRARKVTSEYNDSNAPKH